MSNGFVVQEDTCMP